MVGWENCSDLWLFTEQYLDNDRYTQVLFFTPVFYTTVWTFGDVDTYSLSNIHVYCIQPPASHTSSSNVHMCESLQSNDAGCRGRFFHERWTVEAINAVRQYSAINGNLTTKASESSIDLLDSTSPLSEGFCVPFQQIFFRNWVGFLGCTFKMSDISPSVISFQNIDTKNSWGIEIIEKTIIYYRILDVQGFRRCCRSILYLDSIHVNPGLINPLPPPLHQKVQKIFNIFWSDQSPQNKETSRPEDNWTTIPTIPYYSTKKLLWLANFKMGGSNWGGFVAYP